MHRQFEYIDTEQFTGFASIEINDVNGMVKLAESNHVKFIFRAGIKEKEGLPSDFFFPVNNTIFIIKANGFHYLDDYYKAVQKKFPSPTEYYEAVKNGYDLYEEFKHSKNNGTNSGKKEDFDIAKTKGFVKNFDTFLRKIEKYKTNPRTLIPDDKIENPVTLHEYAESKGFETYSEFEKAYDAGYPDKLIYTEATSKGFKSSENYFDAVTKGFTLPSDYELAISKRMANKKELEDYRFLKSGNYKSLAFDEHHLLMVLREFDNGKKFTIEQLQETLTKEQEKYKREFPGSELKVSLPLWYEKKIDTLEKLHDFMCVSEDIKKMGTYLKDSKLFEIFRLSKTKVYVDASNVAYNSRVDKSKNPLYKNIRLLLQDLHVWKFTDIVVIADASLRHNASDKEELQQIKKLAEYHESPSKTQADEFLLKAIRRNKCIIVSNDTFSDWQKKDDWIRFNIDKLRVPFMIEANGNVSMPKLEEVIKENEK